MAAAPPHAVLKRQIGLGTAIAVLIGSTIGSGIFRSPSGIAEKMPGPGPMLLVWLAAGLLVLCGALTLAEIGSARPQTGGLYVYIREAFGDTAGFLFGWAQLVLIRPAGVGAVAVVFAEYFLNVLGRPPAEGDMLPHYIGAGAIVVVSFLNTIGVVFGAAVQNLTTILKVGGLLTVVILAFAMGLPQSGGHFAPFWPEDSFKLTPFTLAIISVLWAYDGWADVSYVSGEVVNPQRNVPRAILLGTLGIVGVYLLANIAYLCVLDAGQIKSSKLVAADVASALMGPFGLAFVTATVMVSTFGTLNGSMLTAPRIFFAMADDGLFFRPVASVSAKYGTPAVATWLACFLGVGFVLNAKFEHLADFFVTAMIPFYALAIASIFVLRRKNDFEPTVRTPLYPLTPILFIVAMLLVLGSAVWDDVGSLMENGFKEGSKATIGTLLAVVAGLPVYWLTVGRRRKVESD